MLINGLESRSDRTNAAYGIGELGEMASEALPLLEDLLTDNRTSTRCVAAAAICKITGDPTTEISVAVDLLDADGWLDRYVGAEHLGWLEAMAESALPSLRLSLDDDNPCVRTAAKDAIQRIEGTL